MPTLAYGSTRRAGRCGAGARRVAQARREQRPPCPGPPVALPPRTPARAERTGPAPLPPLSPCGGSGARGHGRDRAKGRSSPQLGGCTQTWQMWSRSRARAAIAGNCADCARLDEPRLEGDGPQPSSCQRPLAAGGRRCLPSCPRGSQRHQHQLDVPAHAAGRVLERGGGPDHAAEASVAAMPDIRRASVAHLRQGHADGIERGDLVGLIERLALRTRRTWSAARRGGRAGARELGSCREAGTGLASSAASCLGDRRRAG